MSLSRFGGLTVRPWAASFFSSLLVSALEGVRPVKIGFVS
jgi:hypothetical protein